MQVWAVRSVSYTHLDVYKRQILKDAFIDNDGQKVPLVWNHQHNDPLNVLGHALLENRDEGVYAYCVFNETESGQNAKMCIRDRYRFLCIFLSHKVRY